MKLFLKKDPMFFVYAYISISKHSKKIKKNSGRQGATLIRVLGWQSGCDLESRPD